MQKIKCSCLFSLDKTLWLGKPSPLMVSLFEMLTCLRHALAENVWLRSTARVSLAEVFHPWVRWEGPGSGFENSSGGGAGGVWTQAGGPKLGPRGWAQAGPKWVGPSRAQVGGPKLGPSGGAQAGPKWVGPSWAHVGGPKWVGPGYTDLAPLGLRSKNKVFERPG